MQSTNEKQIESEENTDMPLKLKVDSKANDFVNPIVNADMADLRKRRDIVKRVDNYGVDTLNLAENRSKNLSGTISSMTNNNTNNELDKNIEKLENEIRSLDPSLVDFSKVVSGIGKLFSPITQYFNKLEHEDEKIEDLITSLNTGRSILSNDNITLELEIEKISDTIHLLNLEYEVGEKIKEKITKIIEEAKEDESDAQVIKFYEDEVITPLEKKLYDIKQVIVVNEQSMMAMEIIRNNNKELIRNVDRIKNVTLVAVNTAVMVAKSLYNQKVILKRLNALESSTGEIISKTGDKLKDESVSIANEISRAGTSVEGMKKSFSNAFETFNEIKSENVNNKNEIEKVIEQIGGKV